MQCILTRTALWLVTAGMFFIAQATASTPVQKDSKVINTLFAQTKPQCIGRYVIDVPESFNNQLHDMIFIDDFKYARGAFTGEPVRFIPSGDAGVLYAWFMHDIQRVERAAAISTDFLVVRNMEMPI